MARQTVKRCVPVVLFFASLVVAAVASRDLAGLDVVEISDNPLAPSVGLVTAPAVYGGVNPVVEILNQDLEATQDGDMELWNYTISVKILSPSEGLPLPSGPADCDPMAPGVSTSDGLPFVVSRVNDISMYSSPQLPDIVREKTGFNVVSIGLEPCGHPPVGHFTVPHWDIHFYYATPEERTSMTCPEAEQPMAPPLCFSPDSEFFNIPENLANMPDGFVMDPSFVGVKHMGLHWWAHPISLPWSDVTHVMGTFAGKTVFWELMVPDDNVPSGSARGMTYGPNQDMEYLPYGYDLSYTKDEMLGNIMSISVLVPRT